MVEGKKEKEGGVWLPTLPQPILPVAGNCFQTFA